MIMTMNMTRRGAVAISAAAAMVATLGAAPASAATAVSKVPVVAFQAAGAVGGGVLEADDLAAHDAWLRHVQRGSDWMQVNIQTSNLPAGAYTVWWIVFDTPAGCSDTCGKDDLFNPAANVTADTWTPAAS